MYIYVNLGVALHSLYCLFAARLTDRLSLPTAYETEHVKGCYHHGKEPCAGRSVEFSRNVGTRDVSNLHLGLRITNYQEFSSTEEFCFQRHGWSWTASTFRCCSRLKGTLHCLHCLHSSHPWWHCALRRVGFCAWPSSERNKIHGHDHHDRGCAKKHRKKN